MGHSTELIRGVKQCRCDPWLRGAVASVLDEVELGLWPRSVQVPRSGGGTHEVVPTLRSCVSDSWTAGASGALTCTMTAGMWRIRSTLSKCHVSVSNQPLLMKYVFSMRANARANSSSAYSSVKPVLGSSFDVLPSHTLQAMAACVNNVAWRGKEQTE
jgi:hypothetical protein